MNEERIGHKSVLLDEVIKLINPKSNEIYFDTTFGDGGYAKKILDACAVSYTHLTLPTSDLV